MLRKSYGKPRVVTSPREYLKKDSDFQKLEHVNKSACSRLAKLSSLPAMMFPHLTLTWSSLSGRLCSCQNPAAWSNSWITVPTFTQPRPRNEIKALEVDRCAEGSIVGAARQFNYCDDASSLLTQREHLPSASPSHPAVASFVLQDVHETNVPVSPWPPSRK